jgi:hypothetical protein
MRQIEEARKKERAPVKWKIVILFLNIQMKEHTVCLCVCAANEVKGNKKLLFV